MAKLGLWRLRRRLIASFLRQVERRLYRSGKANRFPPVFIIGAPRSGTTVIYQAFVRAFQPAYFCNFSAQFPQSPIAATWVARHVPSWYSESFRSHYGLVRGMRAPHEGGEIWNRWFPLEPHYMGAGELDLPTRQRIGATIGGIERVSGRPFVNKNVKLSVRIQAMNEIFPGCVFIVVARERIKIAQSLLNARRELRHDESEWFSVKPKAYPTFANANYIESVCRQLFHLEEDITRDAAIVGHERFLYVQYERFCTDPNATFVGIERFLARHKIPLSLCNTLPDEFRASDAQTISNEDYAALERTISQLFAQTPAVDGSWESTESKGKRHGLS